jgi:hypothetical protein
VIRLVADANLSRRFVAACLRLQPEFPIVHLTDWLDGKHRASKDPVLLPLLREHGLVIVGFDRRTMAMHARQLTREGAGHAGVILFRRNVSQMDYGKQSRLLFEFWREAKDWPWADIVPFTLQAPSDWNARLLQEISGSSIARSNGPFLVRHCLGRWVCIFIP